MKLNGVKEWMAAVWVWIWFPRWYIRTLKKSRWWDAKYITVMKNR